MGYFYKQRILAVPVAGYEKDYKKLKKLLEKSVEKEDFSKLENLMELDYYDASVDTSEDYFVEATDEYCQFFIESSCAGEGFVCDAIRAIVEEFKVCVYNAYAEEEDNNDGIGIGITSFDSIDEYGELNLISSFCGIDEKKINDGSWFDNCNLPDELGSEKMETILARIGSLAWDNGYEDDGYKYESSEDALQCFKKIATDLNMIPA